MIEIPTAINYGQAKKVSDRLPDCLAEVLPYKLYGELLRASAELERIEELRCRLSQRAYVTVGGKNVALSYVTSPDDMEKMTSVIFGNSLYAHRDTLLEGYVTLSGGVRVGVCGRASLNGGAIRGVYDITSLNFRLPSRILSVGEPVVSLIRQGGSALIYSPPGVGKTTLLRSVATRLSTGEGALRVSVVDTRGELSLVGGCLGGADVLLGYPKGIGIEIAARVFNPQLIVCDEIGSEGEAEAIISAANCGVPLLASAHGDVLSSLLCRSGLRKLHVSCVFTHYVGITRGARGELSYGITERGAADALI